MCPKNTQMKGGFHLFKFVLHWDITEFCDTKASAAAN